jgi:hypothetical protein
MIVIRDPHQRRAPPPWMAGAPNLQEREAQAGKLWGIGPAWLLGPADHGWESLPDGYQVRLVGEIEPQLLRRRQVWCDTMLAHSMDGAPWIVPVILSVDGRRSFRVNYGPNYLPTLTDEQGHALAVAEEVRTLLAAISERQGVDASLMVRYAAYLLALTNHITPEILAALRLIDDVLALDTLTAASGLRPPASLARAAEI